MQDIHNLFNSLHQGIEAVSEVVLYRTDQVTLTLGSLIVALALVMAAFLAGAAIQRWLISPALRSTKLSQPLQYAIARISGYAFTILFLLIVLQNLGLDLRAFTFLAGALGIGIGFGLQNIISNFVSGLIILIEQPVKIGDRIDLGDLAGVVRKISARSTIIRTNDNIDVIVPNSDLITNRVINWSYEESKEIRFRIPVGVAYGTDPEKIRRCLLELATPENHVLLQPPPQVFFDAFGDSSLNFELAVWNRDMSTRPRAFRSLINYAIARKFKDENIELPFPQRDLHLRDGILTIRHLPPALKTS
ncbi:MAG: mechanosensitive ion channel [Blastochloris sp.]|nr:mechanosensitive ion channel [Blastochloris sp.]